MANPQATPATSAPATQETINPYTIETIVNNLPENLDALMHQAFTVQGTYTNETDFRVAFLDDAVLAQVKYVARGTVVTYEAGIKKAQKLNKKLNWEQAVEKLRKVPAGKRQEELKVLAEALILELKG